MTINVSGPIGSGRGSSAPMPGEVTASDDPIRFIRLREVLRRTGVSGSEWYRRVARGDAPAQVKISERTSVWIESEVSAWIEARIAARDEKGAA